MKNIMKRYEGIVWEKAIRDLFVGYFNKIQMFKYIQLRFNVPPGILMTYAHYT